MCRYVLYVFYFFYNLVLCCVILLLCLIQHFMLQYSINHWLIDGLNNLIAGQQLHYAHCSWQAVYTQVHYHVTKQQSLAERWYSAHGKESKIGYDTFYPTTVTTSMRAPFFWVWCMWVVLWFWPCTCPSKWSNVLHARHFKLVRT